MITVIIATCGRPERLRVTLEHVNIAAAGIGGCSVIVVDNHPDYAAEAVVDDFVTKRDKEGSLSATSHANIPTLDHCSGPSSHRPSGLESCIPHLVSSLTHITYLRSEPFNKAKALNVGIAAAQTEWLAFTDDDTLPQEDWLRHGMHYARESGVRVFGGRVLAGPVPPGLPRWLTPGVSSRVPSVGVFVRYEPLYSDGRLPDTAPAPFGANVFIHRDVFRQHGCYDEVLWDQCRRTWPLGCEDSEFGHRLKLRGEAIGYCHQALVIHPVNADRAHLKLHLWRAYCDGWRQPLIFTEEHRPRIEGFRLRLVARRLVGLAADLFRHDPAGAVEQLVEGTRLVGSVVGRWRSGRQRPVVSDVALSSGRRQSGPMRIGFFTSIEEYGGSEMYLRALILGVRAAGHEVTLFGIGAARLTQELRDAGVRCVVWRERGQPESEKWQEGADASTASGSRFREAKSALVASVPRSLRLVLGARRDARRLCDLFRQYHLDLVHVNVHGYEAACRACRLAWVPNVAMCLNYPVKDWDAARRFLRRSLLRSSQHVTSQSAACSRAWAQVADLEPWRVSHIWNSADDALLGVPREPWEPRGQLRLLATGRIHWMKAYDRLVEAMAMLKDLDVRLTIAGEGRDRDTLRSMAQRLGLGGVVDLPGYVPDVTELLRNNDVYVMPSVALESGPASLAEAMMAGMPCVTSDFGPLPEMNVDGVTGLVVPAGDSAAMGGAIRELAENPATMTAMSKAARYRARVWFTRGDMIRRHLTMYREVVGMGQGARARGKGKGQGQGARGKRREVMKPATVFFNLLWALVSRDIRGQYRRSILGPAWAIIRPVFMMVVFTFVHGVLNISSDGIPYPIFSFCVLVPWVFFTSTVTACGSCIMGNSSIVKKMPIAREVFPLTTLLTSAFDMLMSGVVLAAMMAWYRVPVGWCLFWVPVLVAATAVLALGIGMFLAAFGTFRRDFLMAGGFAMQLWLYASPIIYPLSSVPERWRDLYVLNPMVGILEGFRSVLARGVSPDLTLLAWALPGIIIAVLIGWPLFRRMSQYFADVL